MGGPFGQPEAGPAEYDPNRVMSAHGMQIEALADGHLAAILDIDGIVRVEPLSPSSRPASGSSTRS